MPLNLTWAISSQQLTCKNYVTLCLVLNFEVNIPHMWIHIHVSNLTSICTKLKNAASTGLNSVMCVAIWQCSIRMYRTVSIIIRFPGYSNVISFIVWSSGWFIRVDPVILILQNNTMAWYRHWTEMPLNRVQRNILTLIRLLCFLFKLSFMVMRRSMCIRTRKQNRYSIFCA